MWLILPVLMACGGSPEDTDPSADWNLGRDATSDGGAYTLHYQPSPDPIPANAPFTLAVQIDEAGSDQVELELDAYMPEHGHGMNTEPVVQPKGDGFEVDGMLFHMTGHWELAFVVRAGTTTETAVFDVDCCDF